jgi:hypothetical protein
MGPLHLRQGGRLTLLGFVALTDGCWGCIMSHSLFAGGSTIGLSATGAQRFRYDFSLPVMRDRALIFRE